MCVTSWGPETERMGVDRAWNRKTILHILYITDSGTVFDNEQDEVF